VSVAAVIGVLGLSLLQGTLVALPRGGAFAPLVRLRSRAWAMVLPGAIVVGTFAPLWHRAFAAALVIGAATTTPLLAVIAVALVARARRALALVLAVGLAVTTAVGPGTAGQLALTSVTALASLTVGVALTRVIPRRWLLIGVGLMAAADVCFLGVGVGLSADGAMAAASASFHGPHFTQASVGPAVVDYPDLVLASVLGGVVAGSALQRRAAVAVALLAASTGMLLTVVPMVPETVPTAVTFGLLAIWRRAPLSRAGRSQARAAGARAPLPRAALRVRAGLPASRHLVPQPCPHGCP
jgi:hypothetical protein